jgi:hypothetical protein
MTRKQLLKWEGSTLFRGVRQPYIIGNATGERWLLARVSCFQITEILLVIGNIFEMMEGYWQ